MITLKRTRSVLWALAIASLVFASPALAVVNVAATDFNFDSNTGTSTNAITGFTVSSGVDRKLVVEASWESGNTGISATWLGTEVFTVIENTAAGRNSAILILDNPTPGTGNIVVTYGANTASRIGAISLTGAADGVNVSSKSGGATGTITTTVPNTLVTGVYTTNNPSGSLSGPFANQVYNGNSGSSRGNAGYQNEAAPGLKSYTWTGASLSEHNNALAGFVAVNETPAPPFGQISVIRSESLRAPGGGNPKTASLLFDAGDQADKIVVQLSSETGASISSITYNGVALTEAVAKAGRNSGIFYLDNPFTGGAANLEVVYTAGANNGIGLGVVSLAGTAPGVSAVGTSTDGSVAIQTLVDNSFVLAGIGTQDGNGLLSADGPLTQIYGGDIGSARGAAGYQNGLAVGMHTFSFSNTNDQGGTNTFAAAFAPITIPEPATATLGLLALAGLMRRRGRTA